MDRKDHNISTDYHPDGSDARPKDTLDRDVDSNVVPSTTAPGQTDKDPVVDEQGRPLSGDGVVKDARPVTTPSRAEQLPTAKTGAKPRV